VREKLDNLVFVVNCNLQRLDGPVRGNGKIIQELEAAFLGAGWNVIKVLWGSRWDPLLAKDTKGLLRRVMEECVDGEYQNFKAKGGAYTRENFFGKYPELTRRSGSSIAVAMTHARCTRRTGKRPITRVARPSFSRRP
jgi:pyruvate dehydrogenase E1 component